MAGLIDVAVLPQDVRTVDEALELLLRLPSTHAFVTDRGKQRVLHAGDLLAARKKGVTAIRDVEGRRLARVPQPRLAPVDADGEDEDDVRSVFATGEADRVYEPIFRRSGTDYLLADVDGNTATLITRSERLEVALGQAVCECNKPEKHTRDG
ncbi:MAG: hypothetical protein MJA32_13945, partial [Proteobacteria bacterium]|nr:hypothetical protein [Pseudomonadota bacterium]